MLSSPILALLNLGVAVVDVAVVDVAGVACKGVAWKGVVCNLPLRIRPAQY